MNTHAGVFGKPPYSGFDRRHLKNLADTLGIKISDDQALQDFSEQVLAKNPGSFPPPVTEIWRWDAGDWLVAREAIYKWFLHKPGIDKSRAEAMTALHIKDLERKHRVKFLPYTGRNTA